MSHKYEVDDLRKRALNHLSSSFATSLADWWIKDAKYRWRSPLHSIAIICLARQVSAGWVIPTAVYHFCEDMKEEYIIDGVRVNGSPFKLDRSCQLLVMRASQFLCGDATCEIVEFLWDPPEIQGCDTPRSCPLLRCRIRANVEKARRHSAVQKDDIGFNILPLDLFDGHMEKAGVCGVCVAEMKKAHQRALKSLWDRLPGLCGLPQWDELERMKVEALK